MRTKIETFHIIQLAEFLELGCQSGKDWTQVFLGIIAHPVDQPLKLLCEKALQLYKWQSASEVFLTLETQSKDPLQKMFFRVLVNSQKSSLHLSVALRGFIQTARGVQKLRMQMKSLMFLPRFQALIALAIVLLFVAVLPLISPLMFPTFLQMKRFDLFVIGVAGVALGFVVLWWLSIKPERRLNDLLSQQFLFFFLATFVRTGMDLASAWSEAVSASCTGDLRDQLTPAEGVRAKSFKEFISELIPTTSAPMARNLVGLLWILPTGLGLSDFLQSCAESEAERLLFAWEDEVRRLSVVSILPLSLLIFPSAVFLLAGPQVLGAFSL
jgi:hypothetical protein